jgi:hypothetical protein
MESLEDSDSEELHQFEQFMFASAEEANSPQKTVLNEYTKCCCFIGLRKTPRLTALKVILQCHLVVFLAGIVLIDYGMDIVDPWVRSTE